MAITKCPFCGSKLPVRGRKTCPKCAAKGKITRTKNVTEYRFVQKKVKR